MSAVILIAVDTLSESAESTKTNKQYFSLENAINKSRRWSHVKVRLNGSLILKTFIAKT